MIKRQALLIIIILILIPNLLGSTEEQAKRIFVHPIFWNGPSYYRRNKFEEVIRRVFINCGQYEYSGNREYNKLIKEYPEYFNCTELYCVYEIAWRLGCDYLSLVYIDETVNNYDVSIKIYDSDSLKVRYSKEISLRKSDLALTDSLKSAFYKWNNVKYLPKTEIYDKYSELLLTRWNLLRYNIKRMASDIHLDFSIKGWEARIDSVINQEKSASFPQLQYSQCRDVALKVTEPLDADGNLQQKYRFMYQDTCMLDSICIFLKNKNLRQENGNIVHAPKPVDNFKALEDSIIAILADQNKLNYFSKKFRSGDFFQYELLVNTSGDIIFIEHEESQDNRIDQEIRRKIIQTSFQPALVNNTPENKWIEIAIYIYY